jgi:hypothetical protein
MVSGVGSELKEFRGLDAASFGGFYPEDFTTFIEF